MALTQRQEDGITPGRLEAHGPDLDPVRTADGEILDEVAAARIGGRAPTLAVRGVAKEDCRALERQAAAGHSTFHGRTGHPLGLERCRDEAQRRVQADTGADNSPGPPRPGSAGIGPGAAGGL
jgi:hypothetical protein